MISLGKFFALGSPVLLLVANLALTAIAFQFVDPAREKALINSERLVRETGSLRRQIQKMVRERQLLPQRQKEYEKLLERRFVGPQDRLRAIRVLEDLRKRHKLTKLKYQFAPERDLTDKIAKRNGFKIKATKVSILLRSHLDLDLVDFARDLDKTFPGQVKVESLTIRREIKPTRKILIGIRNGKQIDLVSGAIVFEWRTVEPVETKKPAKRKKRKARS
jgi:hypothetical protein